MKHKAKVHAHGKIDDAPSSRGTEKPTKLASDSITIQMVSVSSLQPNGWNANVMSEEDEVQFANEVRRLGRLPKPIVVRKRGKGYQIVDGEHSWKAARECGLKEVPCEIIDTDEFEAMLQTFKRNRHGENDRVKLGRLFQRMMQEKQLSGRQLGLLIGESEGTIRNFLLYAEAAAVRNSYAPERAEGRRLSADVEVAGLSVRQVHTYMALPADRRDEWLDAGARISDAERFQGATSPASQIAEAGPLPVPIQRESSEHSDGEVEASQRPEDDAVPADDLQAPASAPATISPDQQGSPNHRIPDSLDDLWQRADRMTREKFLAGVLAEPNMLAFARSIISQAVAEDAQAREKEAQENERLQIELQRKRQEVESIRAVLQQQHQEVASLRAELQRQHQTATSLRAELERQRQQTERERARFDTINKEYLRASEAEAHWRSRADEERQQASRARMSYLRLLAQCFGSGGFPWQTGGGMASSPPLLDLMVLGLQWPCTREDLKKAHRAAVKEYHPDRNLDDKQAEENFKKAQAAYDRLCDEFDKLGIR
jgi:ParB-like chromosome segregation protein Spo0J